MNERFNKVSSCWLTLNRDCGQNFIRRTWKNMKHGIVLNSHDALTPHKPWNNMKNSTSIAYFRPQGDIRHMAFPSTNKSLPVIPLRRFFQWVKHSRVNHYRNEDPSQRWKPNGLIVWIMQYEISWRRLRVRYLSKPVRQPETLHGHVIWERLVIE